MIIPVTFFWVDWAPPKNLSEAEELKLGKQIALMGVDAFLCQFKENLNRSLEKEASLAFRKPSLGDKIFGLAMLLIAAYVVVAETDRAVFIGKRLLVAAAIIFPMVIGFYFWTKYKAAQGGRNWAESLLEKYSRHVASLDDGG